MGKSVKIFVSQRIDLDSARIENDVFWPVRCGAVFDKTASPVCGDNTGDNISCKRESYCELTVQYWAWKNVDADYYGIAHYRRFLSFAPEKTTPLLDNWSLCNLPRLSPEQLDANNLSNPSVIQDMVSQYDLVTMIPVDLDKVERKSVYDQYKTDGCKLHIKDLDVMLEIIQEKYPEYYDAAKQYLFHSRRMYMCNIFIMKKELFQPYCQWLFDILAEFEKRVDMSHYSTEAFRTPGHLGERLFGIYYTWLKQQGHLNALELPLICFKNTDREAPLSSAFPGDAPVPIVFSCSNAYACHCAVTLQSLVDTASSERKYDLFVFNQGLTALNKGMLKGVVAGKRNISLRFIDVSAFFEGHQLYESPTISKETYFRFAIPSLLSCYKKALFLDCDIIIRRDVADLFDTDIGENWLGACIDVCESGSVNGFNPEAAQYVQERMRIKDPCLQFNAGILVMNLEALRQNLTTRYMVEFAEIGAFRFQDQDVLNILCEDHIYWLDAAWNYAADPVDSYRGWVTSFAPKDIYAAYTRAGKNPFILHYAGNEKPWWHPEFQWADAYWATARRTPYYEQLQLSLAVSRMPAAAAMAAASGAPAEPTRRPSTLLTLANALFPEGSRRRQWPRKLADRCFPYDSKRRTVLKHLLPFLVRHPA